MQGVVQNLNILPLLFEMLLFKFGIWMNVCFETKFKLKNRSKEGLQFKWELIVIHLNSGALASTSDILHFLSALF